MAINEIAFFKGVRIQPHHKYVDFVFASGFALLFLAYRIYKLYVGYPKNQVNTDIQQIYMYVKPHLLYLIIGTLLVFVVFKFVGQFLLRFKTKDLAEMIETRGWFSGTLLRKTTEYLNVEFKKTEYDYYPTLFYKRGKKSFVLHIKKDGSRFQDYYLELENIIEPMFNCELVRKQHIGRYLRYEFMPLKHKKRIVMDNNESHKHISADNKIPITEQITWDFVKAPHGLVTGITGGGKTYFLFYIIRELFRRKSEVRLLDPKVSDLSFMKNVIGNDKVADTKGQILKQLREANDEMESRYQMMMANEKYKIGSDFRNFDLSPYFVIFDEVTA
ncbi:FtsK/SpoIIIE domain-containing protein, partial [Staphylococcus succinus]